MTPNDLTDAELEFLSALDSSRQPPPWYEGDGCCGPYLCWQAHADERGGGTAESATSDYDGTEPLWLGGSTTEDDRKFIVLMRNQLPRLIAEVRRRRAEEFDRRMDFEEQDE